jgi:hypothetical protein
MNENGWYEGCKLMRRRRNRNMKERKRQKALQAREICKERDRLEFKRTPEETAEM